MSTYELRRVHHEEVIVGLRRCAFKGNITVSYSYTIKKNLKEVFNFICQNTFSFDIKNLK